MYLLLLGLLVDVNIFVSIERGCYYRSLQLCADLYTFFGYFAVFFCFVDESVDSKSATPTIALRASEMAFVHLQRVGWLVVCRRTSQWYLWKPKMH
jgi:hypothetical protein